MPPAFVEFLQTASATWGVDFGPVRNGVVEQGRELPPQAPTEGDAFRRLQSTRAQADSARGKRRKAEEAEAALAAQHAAAVGHKQSASEAATQADEALRKAEDAYDEARCAGGGGDETEKLVKERDRLLAQLRGIRLRLRGPEQPEGAHPQEDPAAKRPRRHIIFNSSDDELDCEAEEPFDAVMGEGPPEDDNGPFANGPPDDDEPEAEAARTAELAKETHVAARAAAKAASPAAPLGSSVAAAPARQPAQAKHMAGNRRIPIRQKQANT